MRVNRDLPPESGVLPLSIRDVDGTTVVSLSGAVDAMTAAAVRDGIKLALESGPRALVIDLTQVDFLASVGLEILVTTRQAVDASTPVVVVADGPVTRRPIELTKVDEFVVLHPTLEAALAALSS
jgi:anti-anti-sigma factor